MSADSLRPEQEPAMGMLSEAFGSAVAGTKNRTDRVRSGRRGDPGGPSSIGRHLSRSLVVVLVGAGVALMASDVANAKSRSSSKASAAPAFDAQAINAAQLPAPPSKGRAPAPSPAVIMKAEILLDRAGFSPGQIDGKIDDNAKKAISAFQDANGLKPTGSLDPQTWERLTATSGDPVMIEYEIQQADVKGPFNKTIPPHWRRRPS